MIVNRGPLKTSVFRGFLTPIVFGFEKAPVDKYKTTVLYCPYG
jgi:hypothetical protein